MSSPPVIAVVDYGAGNLRSVAKALLRSGLDARVIHLAELVDRALRGEEAPDSLS